MAPNKGIKLHFARFIAHKMIFMAFSNDVNGILSISYFIVVAYCSVFFFYFQWMRVIITQY